MFRFLKLFIVVSPLFAFSQLLFAQGVSTALLTDSDWSCHYSESIIDAGRATVKKNIQYSKNGEMKSNGDVILNIITKDGKKDKVIYYYEYTGVWELKDSVLIEKIATIKAINMTHPKINKQAEVNNILSVNADHFLEILNLTEKTLKLEKQNNKNVLSCKSI